MNARRYCLGLVAGLVVTAVPVAAQAFDLEDYATTYRATRDAMLKATNEVRLAYAAYVLFRGDMAYHGWDVHDAAWQMTPGLVSASCESPPGVAFASNLYGPDDGHAFGNFIREMSDVLSRDAMSAVLRDPEDMASWYRQQRDAYSKVMSEAWVTIQPTKTLPDHCADTDYINNWWGDVDEYVNTRWRAGRDALLKAIREYQLSIPPYKAALAAYRAATDVYTYGTGCNPGPQMATMPKP